MSKSNMGKEEDLLFIKKRTMEAINVLNTFLEGTSDLEEDCCDEEKSFRLKREIQVVFQIAAQFSAQALIKISRYYEEPDSLINIHEAFIAALDSYMAELEEQNDKHCEKRKKKGTK